MTRLSVEMLAADAPPPISTAGHAQLGIAVLVGIAVIVLLITKFKLHAFLALTIGSLALGAAAGAPLDKVLTSFTTGLGATVASVGVLIALGATLGKLLADSGARTRSWTRSWPGPAAGRCRGRWCSSPP